METPNILFIAKNIWLYYSFYRGIKLYIKWIVPTLWMTLVETKIVSKWKPPKKAISKALNWLSHKLDEAVAASWEDIRGGGVCNGIALPCHENLHQPCQRNTKLDPCSLGTPHRTLQIWCLLSQCIVLPKWKPKNGTKIMEAQKKPISKGFNWLSHKLDEAVAASWEDIRGGGVWNGITFPYHETSTSHARGTPN